MLFMSTFNKALSQKKTSDDVWVGPISVSLIFRPISSIISLDTLHSLWDSLTQDHQLCIKLDKTDSVLAKAERKLVSQWPNAHQPFRLSNQACNQAICLPPTDPLQKTQAHL